MTLNIVADANIAGVESAFAPLGHVTKVEARHLTRDQLQHCDVLLVRSVTPVNVELLEGTPVRMVGTATSGFDHVDLDYLNTVNIAFCHAPGSNAPSVVDYVLSVLANIDNYLDRVCAGAEIGIVGCGKVGSRLLQRLTKLGARCLVYDPFLNPGLALPLVSLEEALSAEKIGRAHV